MSTTQTDPEDPAPTRPQAWGWRQALTPTDRASRRRWTVVYALLLIAAGLGTIDRDVDGAVSGDGRGVFLFVLLLVVFGMLRRGTRRLTATDHPELDERDRRARDRAFRLAMPLFVLVVAVTVVLLPSALEHVRSDAIVSDRRLDGGVVARSGWILHTDTLFVLLLWLALWAVYLPTAVLAWNEPDVPVDDEDPHASSAPSALRRDALVGAVVGAAVVLSLVGLAGVGLLLLIGSAFGLSWLTVGSRRATPSAVARVVVVVLVVVGGIAAWGASSGVDFSGSDDGPSGSDEAGSRLPAGVVRWTSQDTRTCLTVRPDGSGDAARRSARRRLAQLKLDEPLCRF